MMVGNARPAKTDKLSSASLRLCETYFLSQLLAGSGSAQTDNAFNDSAAR
jgi:hypothetical protein